MVSDKQLFAGGARAAELAQAARRRGLRLPRNKGHAFLSATAFPSQVFARKTRKYNKVFLLWKTWYQQSCAFVNIAYPAPGWIQLVNKHYQQKHNFASTAALTERAFSGVAVWEQIICNVTASEKARGHLFHGLHAGFFMDQHCLLMYAERYQRNWGFCSVGVLLFVCFVLVFF